MVGDFESMLDRLLESEPFRHLGPNKPPQEPGVYLFVERGRPLYVGITRNLRARYGQHHQDSSPQNSAPFAFALAKAKAKRLKIPTEGQTRKELSEESRFKELCFLPAKRRVRKMKFHYFTVEDQDDDSYPKITSFEVYAAVILGTEGKYNLFRPH